MLSDGSVAGVLRLSCERLGVVMSPDGSPNEIEGVLNPGAARDREGQLLLFPRMVAAGNVSRVGIVRADRDGTFERLGVALEPEKEYEQRSMPGGHGCEDARVGRQAAEDEGDEA